MVTPMKSLLTFVGMVSSRTYSKEIYVADVAETKIKWDSGAGASATTDAFWIAPEGIMLVDVALVTGPTVIKKLQVTRNDITTGDMLVYSSFLDSINNRPPLRIGFARGDKIGAIEKV